MVKAISAYPHAAINLLARRRSFAMAKELEIAPTLFHFSRDALHSFFSSYGPFAPGNGQRAAGSAVTGSGQRAAGSVVPANGQRPTANEVVPANVAWFPTFHCGMEVRAACDAGLEPRFYRIHDDLTVDEDDLARGVRDAPGPVLVIHYFGFPQPGIARIASLGVPLVEDCSHAFLTRNVGLHGEAATFSFYKTLGTADGGGMRCRVGNPAGPAPQWLAPKRRKPYCDDAHRFDELAANARTRIFEGPWQYGRGISRMSLAMIERMDPAFVRERRRRNYATLASMIGGGAPPLGDDTCPLFLPIRVANRTRVWRKLQKARIDTFIFGMFHHPALDLDRFPETRAMRENILCLPIHQDLDRADLERIAEGLL